MTAQDVESWMNIEEIPETSLTDYDICESVSNIIVSASVSDADKPENVIEEETTPASAENALQMLASAK